jgi:hypothetical protein
MKKLPQSEYDTRVTIIAGHDNDLNALATALGATWVLQDYISGPDGVFVPTPPLSGIHAVRDVESDRIDLSFVYPRYAQTGLDYFRLNESGILEQTPLLFHNSSLNWNYGNTSTYLEPSQSTNETDSTTQLEQHIKQMLSKYHPSSAACFDSAAEFWKENRVPFENLQSVTDSVNGTDHATDLVQIIGSFVVGLSIGVLGLIWKQCKASGSIKEIRKLKHTTVSQSESPFEIESNDDDNDGNDDEPMHLV